LNYVLDTDVVSQLSKGRQDPGVIRWIDSIDDDNLFLSAATLIEVRYGIELLDLGKKRQLLEEWLVQKLPRQFDGRIIPIERHVADLAGRIMARAKHEGWLLKPMDAVIGATAMVNDMTLATLNRIHFEKLDVKLVEF
jgi:predicted nucleic acid-binding protein